MKQATALGATVLSDNEDEGFDDDRDVADGDEENDCDDAEEKSKENE